VNEAERKTKYAQQTEQIYAAIGRFAVKFEHVCHAMHSGVMNLLQQDGLRDQRLANAVLEGLTAEPLRRTFAATVAHVRGDQLVGDEKRILANILNRVTRLTEARNDLIHRTWFVGWAAPTAEDFSTVSGWKFRNTTKGVEFRPLKYTAAEFDSLSAQADELADLVNRVNACLILGSSFGANFVVAPDGMVRPKHAKEADPKT